MSKNALVARDFSKSPGGMNKPICASAGPQELPERTGVLSVSRNSVASEGSLRSKGMDGSAGRVGRVDQGIMACACTSWKESHG